MILFRRLIHSTVSWYSPGAWLLGTIANSVSAILNTTTHIPKRTSFDANWYQRPSLSTVLALSVIKLSPHRLTLHNFDFLIITSAVECLEIPGWGPLIPARPDHRDMSPERLFFARDDDDYDEETS
ncbi:hypothetical protein IW262DRAFT_1290981 [Armillaria fumosa]|nr:hypothetical protein IW262DRAFT_1290981 [Armillaria fumosa]